MDFMERMDIGRAKRKRTLERTGGTSCTVVSTAEYYRRRGAGHDDRDDVPYWNPEQVMTDEDWERVAGAVDATPAGDGMDETEEETSIPPAKHASPKPPARATIRPAPTKAMTAKQYKAGLAKLHLSLDASGPALGISRSMTYRYASGSHPIPVTVAKLLRALAELGRADV